MLFIGTIMIALAATGNSAATGYTGSSPITVAACAVETRYDDIPAPGDPETPVPQFAGRRLNITFSNQTSREISSVTFAVSNGSDSERVVDAGKFSPGKIIEHSFATGLSDADPVECRVTFWRFGM